MSRYDEDDECEHELDEEGVCYGCGRRVEHRTPPPPSDETGVSACAFCGAVEPVPHKLDCARPRGVGEVPRG